MALENLPPPSSWQMPIEISTLLGTIPLAARFFSDKKNKNNSYKNYIYILIITWLREPSLGVRLPLRSTIVVMQLASLIR